MHVMRRWSLLVLPGYFLRTRKCLDLCLDTCGSFWARDAYDVYGSDWACDAYGADDDDGQGQKPSAENYEHYQEIGLNHLNAGQLGPAEQSFLKCLEVSESLNICCKRLRVPTLNPGSEEFRGERIPKPSTKSRRSDAKP